MTVYDPNCKRCPLGGLARAAGKHACVPGEGTVPPPSGLALYGEGLGAEEETEGRPFIGQAGGVLNQCIASAGMAREDVYITNTVRCRPPQNRTPNAAEQAACLIYTVRELPVVGPRVIVALGGAAALSLTGKKEVGANRGRLLPMRPEYRSDVPVVVTYHPAAYLHQGHNPAVIDQIATDLRFALKAAQPRDTGAVGPDTADDGEGRVVTDMAPPARLLAALRELATCPRLACDLEWAGVADKAMWPWSRRKGRSPRLVSIALAGEVYDDAVPGARRMVAVAVRVGDTAAYRAMLRLAARIPTIYHNAPGDDVWLQAAGVQPRVDGDTLLLASLLNIPGSLRLKVLAAAHTTMDAGWEWDASRVGEHGLVGKLPVTPTDWLRLLRYNGDDAIATLLLEPALLAKAEADGRARVLPLYRELLRAGHTLAKAATNGVPMDAAAVRHAKDAAEGALKEAKQRVADELEVGGYAWGAPHSNQHVARAVEKIIGVPLPRTDKKADLSIAAPVLIEHLGKHPAIADLLRVSKLTKLNGTYFTPWDYMLTAQGDGRLHYHTKLWNVRSGRGAAEGDMGGTIHQMPRSPKVRSMVRARPGWAIVSADESQVELRVIAWLANERTMLRFLAEGIDLHRATAGFVKAHRRGIPLHTYLADLPRHMALVTPHERQGGKPVNFGFGYGMRGRKFVTQARRDYGLTFTVPEADAMRAAYFTLYADLLAWHADCMKWVRLGYYETPYGRRRPLIMEEGEDEEGLHRKAINAGPQGIGSDLSLIGMAEADEWIERDGMAAVALPLGFIHDAALMEVRIDALRDVCALIKEAMEHPPLHRLGIELPVPLEVDIKVGHTWGEATSLEKFLELAA